MRLSVRIASSRPANVSGYMRSCISARTISVEHFNEEAGAVWMQRLVNTYPSAVWLNPTGEQYWGYSQSTAMIRALMQDRMYPLTLEGLDDAMRTLSRKSSG